MAKVVPKQFRCLSGADDNTNRAGIKKKCRNHACSMWIKAMLGVELHLQLAAASNPPAAKGASQNMGPNSNHRLLQKACSIVDSLKTTILLYTSDCGSNCQELSKRNPIRRVRESK